MSRLPLSFLDRVLVVVVAADVVFCCTWREGRHGEGGHFAIAIAGPRSTAVFCCPHLTIDIAIVGLCSGCS